IRAKTAGGGKTERWVLRTGEADLTIKSERESKKVQPERIDCVGVVELVSPEQKLLLRVNGLQVRLRDGVFEECEGEEFKFESEKMTATGKKIVLTEKGNLLRLIGEVKGELKGTGGKIELECEKVNVRFEEAEYKVVSLEAEEVRRCLVRKEKMENLDVLTESLFYNAVEERLSFGEKDVQLVYGESKFSIKDLKIDMRRMEATGGRVTGVIDSKGLKGDVSAEKTRLSFAEDGLREADFEENVRFDTEGFSLESSRLDFDSPAQEVLIKDVKLASKADALRVAARDCFVFLPLRRVEFEGSPKVSGTRGEKQKWWLEAERMVVVYKETTSSKGRMQIESIDSLYAEKSVKAEIEEEKSTGRLSCEKCVYLKESSKVSIMGAPAVIERGGAVLREKEFVYDLSKGVVESGGKDSGYDWELDPLKLKEKKRKRE
ncbi:MAG: hypothetical protein N2234_03245, partial [Planctomycetota bacterium]|nr:hypothetical protein [Planctomycetota bacterium]